MLRSKTIDLGRGMALDIDLYWYRFGHLISIMFDGKLSGDHAPQFLMQFILLGLGFEVNIYSQEHCGEYEEWGDGL